MEGAHMSMKNLTLAALPLCAALLACGGQSSSLEEESIVVTVRDQSAFVVDVRLSDAAKPRFGLFGESILVSARYYGDPADGQAGSAVNDIGQIDLGMAEVDLSGEGLAKFDGNALLRSRRTLVQGDPQIEISVFSGRRTSPDNLLNCDMFQGSLPDAVKAPVHIGCRLLSEDEDADHQQ